MRLSRRDFVKLSALGLGSAFLASCGTATTLATVKAAVEPTRKSKGQTEGSTPAAANPNFVAAPILGRPTDRSIVANLVPTAAMAIFYEYGTASGSYSARTAPQAAPAGTPLETLIDGLQPDTRYYYRLNYAGTAAEEHSFVTRRAPDSSFTFALQGDSHPERLHKEFDPDLYARTLQRVAADGPDFFLTIGDDFSVDRLKTVNAETVQALYLAQRQWLGQVGAPVFLVNGNHEQAAQANLNGTAEDVAVWAQTARNSLYPQPAPDAFYSGDAAPVPFIGPLRDYSAWTWGDALFVILDQYWHSPVAVDNVFGSDHDPKGARDLWQVTIGDSQYRWFKQTLETSAARYKFVFSHHVLGTGRGGIELAGNYEWGDAAGLAAHRPGWDKTIHQLMADNGVSIYFQGHDHLFVHQELDGLVYQTLPQPADPNYALNNAAAYCSGDKLPSTGYLRVSIAPAGVTVEYVRTWLLQDERNGHATGEVAYTYTVQG